MTWKTYEETIKNIYKRLGEGTNVKIVGYGNNCRVVGKSGVEHQIDVLLEHTYGLYNYRTGIECKYWNKKVTKDTVMKVHEIQQDCNFQKSIIVSKSGFTKDSVKFAEYCDIGLVILREPIEEDWNGRIQIIHTTIEVYYPQIYSYIHSVSKLYCEMKMGKELINFADYYYENENEVIEMAQIVKEFYDFLEKSYLNEEIEKKFIKKFNKGTRLINRIEGCMAEVKSVEIIGKMSLNKIELETNAKDYIWLIMKSVFEKKIIEIEKSGKLRELRNS